MTIEEIEAEARIYSSIQVGGPRHLEDFFESEKFESGFIDGAKWRVNSVWHDVMEVPCRNKIYLAQIGNGAFDTFYDSDNWESFSKRLNFVRWAYIEDLLPIKE